MDKKTCFACDGNGRYIFNGLLPTTHDAETGQPLHSEELEGREIECCDCDGTGIAKPKPTLYTIKPLEWEGYKKYRRYTSYTLTGQYEVTESDWSYYPDHQCNGPAVIHEDCTSIEDGKKKAQEHYEEQLGKCLKVYRG